MTSAFRPLPLAVAALLLALALPAAAEEPVPYTRAKEEGVETCLDKLQKAADVVIGEAPHASHDLWSTDAVDERPFSSFVVKRYTDTDSHLSLVVGPDASGKCFADYKETFVLSQSCAQLAKGVFQEFSEQGQMAGDTAILGNGQGVMVYLTPQGDQASCLVSKRELVLF